MALLAAWLAWGAAVAGPSAALASSGLQCAHSSTYGSQCIEVRGSGRRLRGFQAWFRGTAMLADEKWRIDLERYNCDPIGRTKSECPVAATWHGDVRTGQPAGGRDQAHFVQPRKKGYWSAFYSLPHTFSSDLWLCTELAVYNSSRGEWVYNAAGLPRGLRPCVSVHS